MAAKKAQYIIVPAAGLIASDSNPKQVKFFESLHASSIASSTGQQALHTLATHSGDLGVRVLDSIGERKAKLIECAPADLPALRGAHPSIRVLPVVYFQRAVIRHQIGGKISSGVFRASATIAAKQAALTVTVVSSKDGAPVANAMVVAFTDFATLAGAQGKTDAKGRVSLSLGASSKKIERLYVYPALGYWPTLAQSVTLKNGAKLSVPLIDLGYIDCVRFFYPGSDPTQGQGQGVTVGVIDCGVATDHPGLVVQGGRNTVTGEDSKDFGDNGTDGHGTHVAGIIAARGTPPSGIRGVAPGATIRSYRVFGQGADNATNFAIAKAIDAGVSEQCDLLNMSLGGGAPDTLTEEALTAAHNAGVVVLAATGNDSRKPVSFPAAFSMCQAVSAAGRRGTFPNGTEPDGSVAAPFGNDKKNFVASFSNIGPETDLTGPGVGVMSTVPGGFGVMSGTSMATPAETGAAARLLAGRPNILKMPRDQHRAAAMIEAITASCKLLGFGGTFEGKGIISF
jgi:subtilisin